MRKLTAIIALDQSERETVIAADQILLSGTAQPLHVKCSNLKGAVQFA